jgi:hypothetical protein
VLLLWGLPLPQACAVREALEAAGTEEKVIQRRDCRAERVP